MHTRYAWIPLAALCGAAPAAGNGTIDILVNQSFDTAVVLDVVIVDDGAVQIGCVAFVLQRRNLLDCYDATTYVNVATFARERLPGTFTHQVIDSGLQPNTAYLYRIVGVASCTGFTWAGDNCGYGFPIVALAATTGPGATVIGHGTLRSSGTPWWLVYCGGFECGAANIVGLPAEANMYVDTGIPVLLYGTFERSCSYAWWYSVTQVVPAPCTVDVEGATWSATKMMFR